MASGVATTKPVRAAPTPSTRTSPWRRSTGLNIGPGRPLSVPPALKKRMKRAIPAAKIFKMKNIL